MSENVLSYSSEHEMRCCMVSITIVYGARTEAHQRVGLHRIARLMPSTASRIGNLEATILHVLTYSTGP